MKTLKEKLFKLLKSNTNSNVFKTAEPMSSSKPTIKYKYEDYIIDGFSYFDASYYYNTYTEIKNEGIYALEHYLNFGWKEGKNPNALFNVNFYLDSNPDIRKANIEPLYHYISHGWKEGRNPNNLFNINYYLESNPDIKSAIIEPLYHYLTHGWKEGRNPNALFDVNYYLESNSEVNDFEIEPFTHYITTGWKEGRNPSALFDIKYYLGNNIDAKTENIEPLYHYLTHGWKEYRKPNSFFDVKYYLETYPEVKEAGIEPLFHYLNQGWKEGKNPSEIFNTTTYLDNYPEIRNSEICPLIHFIKIGNIEEINNSDTVEIQDENIISVNTENTSINTDKPTYSDIEQIIANSELFDANWYFENYKLDNNEDPVKHYLNKGWQLLYNPSDRFSTVQYLILNQDVKSDNINPLLHYEMHGKHEDNRIYYEPHVIDFELNNNYKKEQDEYIGLNYDKDIKKLIVYLVPEIDSISGGVMSICSMARVTRDVEELSDYTVLIATLPSVSTFFQYSKFDAGFNVLRFDQFKNYFINLEEIIVHIPEIYVYYFLLKISPADTNWLKRLKNTQINILNQNITLMPRPRIVEYLKMIGNTTTMTCAHKRYCTKQLRSTYDIPVHFFSTSNLIEYKYASHCEKEDIIAYSPDNNPFKEDILSKLKDAFPKHQFIEIKDMSYNEYLSTITKAKWMITFGEGIDGYFMESIRSGSISFSVRNFMFFDENYNDFINIYDSYFDMLSKIVSDIKMLDDQKKYDDYNHKLRLLDSKIYNDADYKNNIKNYYLGNYTFPINDIHKGREERINKKPLISIVIATYNGEAYLEKQLKSLISQTYANFEIIASDDNSSDTTLDILQNYSQKHGIKVIANTKNNGLSENFSNGIKAAKGEYIALCDQDDIWELNKLEVLLERIDDFDIVQGQLTIIDEFDNYHPAKYMHDAYEIDKTSLYSIENYIKENPMLGCATLITKKCIEESMPIPEGFVYHDWWIALIAILKNNGICNIDIPVVKYRQHSTNTAKTTFWSSQWCKKKYNSDKIILKELNNFLNPSAKHMLECDMNLMLLYDFARKFAPKFAFEYFENNSNAFSNEVMKKLIENIEISTKNDENYEQ